VSLAVLQRAPAWVAPAATAAGAAAGCLLVGVVDPNVPGRYPVCPFLALTGRWCPGCGSLRAVHALTRGNLALAFDLNPLFLVLLPALVWSWAAWAGPAFGAPSVPRIRLGVRGPWVLLAAIVAFWILRNLPALAFLAP
jgi:uncharacterized protein DUF2752